MFMVNAVVNSKSKYTKEDIKRIVKDKNVKFIKETIDQPTTNEITIEESDKTSNEITKEEKKDGVESGIVIEVLQKGYVLKDRILRPAMVKVSE